MKELFNKRFWRGVVKTYVEAREGVDRPIQRGQSRPELATIKPPIADERRDDRGDHTPKHSEG